MNELIKITYNKDRPAVSARDLHDFLEVKTAYKDWFPRMCEYGFTEGEDFCSFLSESTGGRPAQDAVLTIDMAKELCMIQRNEKGKQARQYFLQIEKDWNSPEKVMARALQIAGDKLKRLENKVEADAPKVLFADAVSASKYFGFAAIAIFVAMVLDGLDGRVARMTNTQSAFGVGRANCANWSGGTKKIFFRCCEGND